MTKFIIILTLCLLAGGIILIFDLLNLDPKHKDSKFDASTLFDVNIEQQTKSLKDMVSYYKGDKGSYFTNQINKAQDILKRTRRTKEYRKTLILCVLTALAGATIGVIMKNPFAIVLLAGGGLLVPLWRLELYYQKYQKYQNMQLESCISLVTTAYMRNNDIIESIEENIENIDSFIRVPFEEFLAEYKINPNMKRCIRNLQNKIDEPIFKEWCEVLIKAYENSGIKENLIAVSEKYSSVRVVQDDLDAETASAMVEYLIMLGMLVLVYPMVKLLNAEWFACYSTLPGKICVAYSIFVGLIAVKKIIELSAPVQFKR